MDVVRIFDTTLRDGCQTPGCSMSKEEKIRLARQLAALNVDVIEAGFPIASRGDLEAVKKVAQEVRTVPIAALARAKKQDVDAAVEALKPAASSRLHVFLATSDRKSTRLNSSHLGISYAVFCLKKKKNETRLDTPTHVQILQDR